METPSFLETMGFYEALGMPIPNFVASYLTANALDFSYLDTLEKTLAISTANFFLRGYFLNKKSPALNNFLLSPELAGAAIGRNIYQKVKRPIHNLSSGAPSIIKNSYFGLKSTLNKIKSNKNLEKISTEGENEKL